MQFKTKILKNINNPVFIFILTLCTLTANAQMNKIDGVDVVIGKNVVLSSDIAKFKKDIEERSEGKVKISDCEMLEQLMLQKLLSHHAVVDSVLVTETEVNGAVDRNLAYFTQEFGSIENVVKKYGFNDLNDLRTELFTIEKENILVRKEQEKINEGIDVTPEEVRIYFNGLKNSNELPEFQAEIEMAQIVVYAKPTKEENDRIIKKLSQIKKEIEAGANFKIKAVLNSDDPTAAQNGGQMPVTKDSQMVKEFKEVAFSLDVGEVSEPFKTLFGYHIVQLNQIKGKTRIVSHILMQPEILDSKIEEAKNKVAKINLDILKQYKNPIFAGLILSFVIDLISKNVYFYTKTYLIEFINIPFDSPYIPAIFSIAIYAVIISYFLPAIAYSFVSVFEEKESNLYRIGEGSDCLSWAENKINLASHFDVVFFNSWGEISTRYYSGEFSWIEFYKEYAHVISENNAV